MLRSMDAFVKPRDDLQSRSVLGGVITVVAAGAATLLFLAQMYLYVFGSTRHSLHLSESSPMTFLPDTHPKHHHHQRRDKTQIPLQVHITFPHIPCQDLDLAHDNAYYSLGDFQILHGATALMLRKPTRHELSVATQGAVQDLNNACTVQGAFDIDKVGGTFAVTVSHKAWRQATGVLAFGGRDQRQLKLYNVSHHVHLVSFGEPFPLTHNPLENSAHIIENPAGGVGLANVNVRLVPTKYKQFVTERDTYQVSVTEHMVQPEFLAAQNSHILPGLALSYDFTPLTVHHVEYRDNFFVFLSSLVSIVGGVFVTVGLVTGCLVHSAAAVAKKKD